MRKTIATVVTLVLVWIGYTAWPLYDLLVLVRAMETRDVDTVTRHVYFEAVRVSLTNQVVAACCRGRSRRAARALLQIDQRELARRLALSVPFIQRLEAKDGVITGNVDQLRKLVQVIAAAGIELIEEGAVRRG
jgi:Protein of unknown function (DUF2939)